jgi:hexosaminidase
MILRTLVVWAVVASGAVCAAEELPKPAVIPQPVKMQVHDGAFTFDAETKIFVTKETRREGEYLAELLAVPTGIDLPVSDSLPDDKCKNCVLLKTSADSGVLGAEGYRLTVTGDRIVAEAATAAGVFYACQTLRQLLPAAIESECPVGGVAWKVPCVEIEDRPRYEWRGLMLDPGHNFLTKEFTKRYIDAMALYKMNRLHWHLTDMGWAIEIKQYPELTKIENWPPIVPRWRRAYGKCTQGFYTQDDVREIVAYAAERHVTIVPEIELPGHSSAALACYPELLCPNWKSTVEKTDSYFHYPINYCAGNEKTFEFLEGVLSEVIDMFPSPYIHIGGDERVRGAWKACPRCQARIKEEGLANEDELQSYFVKRMDAFVRSKGRQIIGWTEIMEGGLAPEATVQSWLDAKHAVEAASKGHDVIMSTNQSCYLNYRGVTLEKAYAFEPTPPGLSPEAAKHILGVEPCLWGFGQHRHDELVFPRLCAYAEVGWSPKDARDWGNFKTRLKPHGRRLDELGINYRRDPVFAEKPWK